MFYVYIIKSLSDGTYYKGFSESPLTRLDFHNAGLSPYTSKKMPWQLAGVFVFENKTAALQKERKLKKYNTKSLESLLHSSQNIIKEYLGGLENR